LKKECSLGIDVGSVSTNFVLLDGDDNVVEKLYLRTSGRPIEAILKGMSAIEKSYGQSVHIMAAGTTGSGRQLASTLVGADIIKNEITTHAAASCRMVPDVRTIIEIGGQDSKIIFLEEGAVSDFAMNTVCAAGTGSFLDRQAARLEIPLEEFGSYALRSKSPVRIAGRCAVFAESDMISKQQAGHCNEDIIAGLCEALVRNYINNLAKNRDIPEPVMFQGGVAANLGIAAAFEKALGKKLIIPRYYDVMGAFGAALIARDEIMASGRKTDFKGIGNIDGAYSAGSFECKGCANMCEVVQIRSNGIPIAHWGDRCGKWSAVKDQSYVI
jgi:predicted CoA-substrate-specific enzyme activase